MATAARGLLGGGLVGAMAVAFAVTPLGFTLEQDPGLRALFAIRGTRPAPPDVVIFRLDQAAERLLLRQGDEADDLPPKLRACRQAQPAWPPPGTTDRFPRGLHACALDELTWRGAQAVGFDIAFTRADPGTPALAAAIAGHGRVVLLASIKQTLQGEEVRLPDPLLTNAGATTATFRRPAYRRVHAQFLACAQGPDAPFAGGDPLHRPCRPLVDAGVSELPTALLAAEAAPALARLARRLGIEGQPGQTPPALWAWLDRHGRALVDGADAALAGVRASLEPGDLRLLAAAQRVADGPSAPYTDLYGPAGTFRSYPLLQLFEEPDRIGRLDGVTVLVGYQELHAYAENDIVNALVDHPDGIPMSGVEWAATAFANLRDGDQVVPLPEGLRLGLLLLLGGSVGLACRTRGLGIGLVRATALTFGFVGLSVVAFVGGALWLPVVTPLVILPIAVLFDLVRRNGRWRAFIKTIIPTADPIDLRPRQVEATVMFTDIVQATPLQMALGEHWSRFFDRHLALLSRCVAETGGSVIQQTGDGLLAVWEQDRVGPGHADAAVRAARQMAGLLADERVVVADGAFGVRIRVGLCSGPVEIGWRGDGARRHYAVTGSTVTTASRIEQLGRQLQPEAPVAAVLMCSATRRALDDALACVDLGPHEIIGQNQRLHLFALAPNRNAPSTVARTADPATGVGRLTRRHA